MVLRLNSELGSSFLFPVLEVEEVRAPMGFIGFGGCGSRSRPPKAGKIMAQNQKKAIATHTFGVQVFVCFRFFAASRVTVWCFLGLSRVGSVRQRNSGTL